MMFQTENLTKVYNNMILWDVLLTDTWRRIKKIKAAESKTAWECTVKNWIWPDILKMSE